MEVIYESETEGFSPISMDKNYTNEELIKLLKQPRKKVFFCFHKWLYWKKGKATKVYRVCTKCYKKQKDRQISPKYTPTWINY